MKTVFWLSLSLLFYTYFGYPLLMSFLACFKRLRPVDKQPFSPLISIIIAAYNEEKNIGAKLNDILNLDYPKDKMEIFVVSDQSSDSTDGIVEGFTGRGVKLLHTDKRSGKIAAYRKALSQAKGEIIVFSDAASLLNKDSIKNLISNFNDKTVGCVGGLLNYISLKKANVGRGERKYWNYEKKIRVLESKLSSLTSVSGTLYAVRKELYPLNIKDYLADDLIVPFTVKKAGFRTVLEPQAFCSDFTTLTIEEEMAKRIRITVQNIRGLLNQFGILNPFKYGLFSFLVISHKLFRLLVPLLLVLLFTVSLILSFNAWIFFLIFLAQMLFYVVVLAGHFSKQRIQSGLGNVLYYFCLSNLSILIGIAKSFKGEKFATWETVRT